VDDKKVNKSPEFVMEVVEIVCMTSRELNYHIWLLCKTHSEQEFHFITLSGYLFFEFSTG
jgi:hypothetical protein